MFSGVNVHVVAPKWSHTPLGRLCIGWKGSLFHPKQHTSAAHMPVCTLCYVCTLYVCRTFVPKPMSETIGISSQLCRKEISKEGKMPCWSWYCQVQFQGLMIFSFWLNHQDTVSLQVDASPHLQVLPGADRACKGLHQGLHGAANGAAFTRALGLQRLQRLPAQPPHSWGRHCPINYDFEPAFLLLKVNFRNVNILLFTQNTFE